MTDKILTIASLALLIAFMGVVVVFVNEPNLWGVIILVLSLAIYDAWSTGEILSTTDNDQEPPDQPTP